MIYFLALLRVPVSWLLNCQITDAASFKSSLPLEPCHLFTDGTYRCFSRCVRPSQLSRDGQQSTSQIPELLTQLSRTSTSNGEITDAAYGLVCDGEGFLGSWSQKIGGLSGQLPDKARIGHRDYFSTCLFDTPTQTFQCSSGPSCTITALGFIRCKGGVKFTGLFSHGSNGSIVLEHLNLREKEEPYKA